MWKPARHLKLVCDALEKVEKGEIKRLIITMPPRHGKSFTCSETFPSWFIGRDPNRSVIEVSYGSDLAVKFGRANKRKIEEFGKEIFDIEPARDNNSVNNWGIAGHRGMMLSAGIGGGITGQGADLLLIDDPVKNRQEAESETYRNMVWSEWQNTLLTRLHPGGRVVVILTRWHDDDLVGRLLAENPDEWTVLSLPAIAEDEDDLLGRNIGDALWPEHGFDEAWARDKKKAVGSQTWTSLYQQRPSPAEGNMINRGWWRFYKNLPSRFDEIIQSWDCTFKDTKTSDYVVGQVWGRIGADKYLLDQVRAQMDFPSTINAIKALSGKWPGARAKYIEDKANGSAVIATLRREISGLIPVEPEGGKIVRLAAVSPDIEAGNVYIPDPTIAPWVSDYIEEFAAFPTGKHDDCVDSTSQALVKLISKSYKRGPVEKPAGY